jgi:CxxC-x17-CxxC domain-containing protein
LTKLSITYFYKPTFEPRICKTNMGNFRSDNRGGGFGGNRSGGSRFGGRSGGFGRGRGFSSGRREEGFGGRREGGFGERKRFVETEVTCDKCGKQTTVPFKPTGDKPVLCGECFRRGGDSGFSADARPKFESRTSREPAQSGNSSELKQINIKLDRILKILEMIEFEEIPEEDEDGEKDETEAGEESDEAEDLEDETESKGESKEDKEEMKSK